ncbi:hypothetical protein ABVF61_05935 [Roseibium sp. HPY-6]|uniref:hypothetical protein n=1 Tax=Roseibium sp. HPY-6 TaxID=3229852 RepID=UPI00338E5866
MLFQWCLKGVPKTKEFGDTEANEALRDAGLTSAWLRDNANNNAGLGELPAKSHASLSQADLDAHVNSFSAAATKTPYISLSAGTVELDPGNKTIQVYPAYDTALSFATDNCMCDGYIFRLWVLVSPKPGPELPGFAEEVRELNIFRQFGTFHHEGEIAAKLFVPSRQIEWYQKYDRALKLVGQRQGNPNFVPPERINTVLETL